MPDVQSLYLTRGGTYVYRCDTQPWYAATLHVFEHPWFDVTTTTARGDVPVGEFVLRDVPPGVHEVVCRHETVRRLSEDPSGSLGVLPYDPGPRLVRRVRVVAGETVRVDFDVPSEGAAPTPR